jgi:hypothetical protein
MEIEHLYLWLLNKNSGIGDISLRLLLYIQIVHKTGPNPERRLVYLSRRRICKRLAVSIGACRTAVKQLTDLGFIRPCDSKGNPVEDTASNWFILQPRDSLNKPRIQAIIEHINKADSSSGGGSPGDAGSEELFENLFDK